MTMPQFSRAPFSAGLRRVPAGVPRDGVLLGRHAGGPPAGAGPMIMIMVMMMIMVIIMIIMVRVIMMIMMIITTMI